MTQEPLPPEPRAFGLVIIVATRSSRASAPTSTCPRSSNCSARAACALAWASTWATSRERITATCSEPLPSGDVVFSTGGIGATPDDHTRQCAAAALGVPLELHPQAEALIRERMQDVAREQGVPYEPDRADNVHRLNMGVFPARRPPHPQPVQQDSRLLLSATVALRAGLSGDGLADDRMGARPRTTPPCSQPAAAAGAVGDRLWLRWRPR